MLRVWDLASSGGDADADGGGRVRRAEEREEVPSGRNGSQGQGGFDWLLSGTSRAADATEGAEAVEKAQYESAPASSSRDLPQWLLARPGALEAISDKTTTAQV